MYGAPNYMPQVPDSNLTFQQRMPQYGHYYSPPMVSGAAQIQQPAEQQIICRPVASIEEARAIPTDFSGALMILPDLSHGMVYTKQLILRMAARCSGSLRRSLTKLRARR